MPADSRAWLCDRCRALDSHGAVVAGDDLSVYLSVSAHALAVSDVALQTEALVSASAELTAYQLMLAGEKKPSHGSFHFRMDDADVNVAFLSEAARIDLNFAPHRMANPACSGKRK